MSVCARTEQIDELLSNDDLPREIRASVSTGIFVRKWHCALLTLWTRGGWQMSASTFLKH